MANTVIIVGLQWGDEGKGKIIDLLSERADYVVRAQGGNNAGHTIMIGAEEYKFHLIPSGVVYPHTTCLVTGGTVIDPAVLVKEIEGLEQRNVQLGQRVRISYYAHLIMPYQRILDKLYEEHKGPYFVGTTGKGIGPCYADKAHRIGFQLGELTNPQAFREKLRFIVALKNKEISLFSQLEPLDSEQIFVEYMGYAKRLAPFLEDGVEYHIGHAIAQGKKVLFEGAHGTFLDTTYGTYPYVTSSSTLAAGIAAGAGVGPSKIDHVLGIVKAYTTRVGSGPLPTALTAEEQNLFLDNVTAREIGTTTGRKRRIGWFDAPLVREAIYLNGVDSLALMKLDILDNLEEIKICTGYKYRGLVLERLPALTMEWEQLEPIYEVVPGWRTSTTDTKKWDDLPLQAKNYIRRIEQICECSVSVLSVGPERDKTCFLQNVF